MCSCCNPEEGSFTQNFSILLSSGIRPDTQKDGAVLPCMLKTILLDKCEITSNYKVNVSECNQILTMDNDMIFTTYNDLVIILYIMILSKFLLKFSLF